MDFDEEFDKKENEESEDELCKKINRGLFSKTDNFDIIQQTYKLNPFTEKKISKFQKKRTRRFG